MISRKRVRLLRRWRSALAALAICVPAAFSVASEKPNVLLMLADDLGY